MLLAVGIGWSVWLPGTREGRMMPDGQEQGVQAVQLLLSDGCLLYTSGVAVDNNCVLHRNRPIVPYFAVH